MKNKSKLIAVFIITTLSIPFYAEAVKTESNLAQTLSEAKPFLQQIRKAERKFHRNNGAYFELGNQCTSAPDYKAFGIKVPECGSNWIFNAVNSSGSISLKDENSACTFEPGTAIAIYVDSETGMSGAVLVRIDGSFCATDDFKNTIKAK